ncbi:MAG: cytochrome P450 [Actinomycetota bacterium]
MPELVHELVFDPMSLDTHENPFPLYTRLREEAPVYYNEEHDFWALSRFADVMAAEDEWATFTGRYGVDLDDTSNQFGDGIPPRGFFLGYDPPRHTDIRRAMHGTFLPRSLKEFEPMIRARCNSLVEAFIDKGSADLVDEFATPYPDLVFAEIIGFPPEQHARLSKLLRTALLRDIVNLPPPFIPQIGLDAGGQMRAALKQIVEKRRSEAPRDDLLGRLLLADVEAEPMPAEEIVGIVFFIFTAGTEEVTGLITNALRLLAEHPDQRAMLLENPAGIATAVEETLRYETIVQHLVKRPTRPVELHGRTIPEDARVLLLYGSANRDERVFENAESYDITRRITKLASFGGGIHRCLGAPLARLEAKIALETLLPLLGEYTIADDIEWSQRVNFRGLRKLPLAWTRRP